MQRRSFESFVALSLKIVKDWEKLRKITRAYVYGIDGALHATKNFCASETTLSILFILYSICNLSSILN